MTLNSGISVSDGESGVAAGPGISVFFLIMDSSLIHVENERL